jgi:hypothetical protein
MSNQFNTKYLGSNVKVYSDVGELLTLSKINIDVEDKFGMEGGVITKKSVVNITGSIEVKTSTAIALHPIQVAKDAINAPHFEFINYSCAPDGEIPYEVVLTGVYVNAKIPEADKLEGKGLMHAFPIIVGNAIIGGYQVNDTSNAVGI